VEPGCSLLKLSDEEMKPENLKAALEKRAKEMTEKLKEGDVTIPGPPKKYTLESDRLEPCLSVAVDKKGNVFYGQNTGKRPEQMDPRLSKAAVDQAKQPRTPQHHSVGANTLAGTHSEVHATDRALKSDPETQPKDVTVYNHDPRKGTEKPCCPNCTGTLNADKKDGVQTTTDPTPRDKWWKKKEGEQ
jgi:hypothetical protein